jgi:hypothetical protein
MRRRITIENVYDIEPYRSILGMFIFSNITEKKNKKGLTFEQLRLAFVGGEDFNKIITYFGERLRPYIKQNCIRTKNDLNNTYLKKLLDLQLIRKDNRYIKPRYFLSNDFFIRDMRGINKECLDEYRTDQIMQFNYDNKTFKQFNYFSGPRYLVYGFSDNMNLSPAESKKIKGCLRIIENFIHEIEEIKIKKLFQLFKIKKKYDENDKTKFQQFLQDFTPHPGICISRFYPGSSKLEYDMKRFKLILELHPDIIKQDQSKEIVQYLSKVVNLHR